MKGIRILIILLFILVPLTVFAGGSKETGSTTTTAYQGNEDPNEVDTGVTESSDTESIGAGEQGMAQVPGTSGPNQAFPGTVPNLSGAKESTNQPEEPRLTIGSENQPTEGAAVPEGTEAATGVAGTTGTTGTAGTTGTLGAGKQGEMLKTIGNNQIRFSDISGYNFGTGKVKDLVLSQDGTIQYIVVNMNNAEGDFLVPPSMVSIASANGGITPTFNFGAAGSGTMTQTQGSAQTQLGSGAAPSEATFASSLLKYNVLGSDNQKIGKVDDIVFDLQNGKVSYLAVSQGGALGVGKNLYAVSFDNAQLDPQQGAIMLNISANDLKNAKGFDKANWPAQAEIGTQANLGSGNTAAQGNVQSGTQQEMGTQGSGTVDQATTPQSSDTTQPGNTPNAPENNPQSQMGAEGNTGK